MLGLSDVKEDFSDCKVAFVAAIYGITSVIGSPHPPSD